MQTPESVVVTGSSGFVGSRLVSAMEAAGAAVTGLDIATGHDLTRWEGLEGIPPHDLIFHLAAITYVPDSFERPGHFFKTNFSGTLHMLELARNWSCPLVFASSYVYGPPDYLPIDELHPTKAVNPYMASKLICEDLCRSYSRSFDIPIVIIRPFNIYGPGQTDSFLIPRIVSSLRNGVVHLGDPEPKRDMVYIDDVIDAYVKASAYRPDGCDTFNIASGVSHSVREITELVEEIHPQPIEFRFSKQRRKNEIMETTADIRKVGKLLGWKPRLSLRQGLVETLAAAATGA